MDRGVRLHLPVIYRPVLSFWDTHSPSTQAAIRWYVSVGSEYGWAVHRVNSEWRWVKFGNSVDDRQHWEGLIIGACLGAFAIFSLVQWMNRRDDPRGVNPPALPATRTPDSN